MQPTTHNAGSSGVLSDRHNGTPYAVIGFLVICLLPAAFAWGLVRDVLALTFRNDTFTYIPLIPLVSAYLIYAERKSIFSAASNGWRAGGLLIALGAASLAAARFNFFQVRPENQVSLLMLAFVLTWAGAFALFFGERAFRAASFPLLFLVFAIPIPEPMLSQITLMLQQGSASATAAIFQLLNVPFLRQDLVFELPGVAIRVAEECSGIRSSLALLITTVLASHFFLRSGWRKLVLCILVIPIVVLKNGLRIATLSTLAIYVNPGFLYGRLHHQGGVVFFLIALVPMAFVLLLLQKSENRKSVLSTTARAPMTAITPPLKDGE
ncbi:MAG: exosortase/archaeosortase family protein [Candidatus Acidiferrales bacterium]